MKKLISIALLSAATTVAFAQSAIQITSKEDLVMGGQQPMAISDNGKFIVGASSLQLPFIYSVEEGTTRYFTLEDGVATSEQGSPNFLCVDNNGNAYGFDAMGAVIANYKGSYKVFDPISSTVKYLDPQDVTPDGSVIVGKVSDASFNGRPCIWVNEKRIQLTYPDEKELGYNRKVYGAEALFVSEDGSVIVGVLQLLPTYPLIVWYRQEDGSYKYDVSLTKKYFEQYEEIIWDENQIPTGFKRGPNPYIWFQPYALSGDGKNVAMYLQKNSDTEFDPPRQAGYLNLVTGEVTDVPLDDSDLLAEAGWEFSITGISNDLTIVGHAGNLNDNYKPFIIYHDKLKVENLATVYSSLPLIQEYTEIVNDDPFYWWWPVMGITPDGKYIIGYFTDLEEYLGYLITTTNAEDNAVGSIEAESSEDAPVYNLNGIKVLESSKNMESLPRGLYISGGKKVVR